MQLAATRRMRIIVHFHCPVDRKKVNTALEWGNHIHCFYQKKK